MLIIGISFVAAKPVESNESYDDEHFDSSVVYQPDQSQQHDDLGSPQATYDSDYSDESGKKKRSLPSDELARQTFFDNINKQINRQVRRAQEDDNDDDDDDPTIDLGDLLHAVEHTLIHSAHNLAIANATNTSSFSSDETSTVISLPISFPTPSTESTLLDDVEVSSSSESHQATEQTVTGNTNIDDVNRPVRKAAESIIPIQSNGHIGLLTPIVFSSSTSDDLIKIKEVTPQSDDATTNTTSETLIDEDGPQNITIIQTIKSSEISPPDEDSVVRVQQQHITLFSAAAGIFPSLPSIDLDKLATLQKPTDCTEENSESSSTSTKSSNESPEKPESSSKCKSNIDSSSLTTTDSPAVKKVDNLQEKIAEVEAEPVILTQGI